MSLVGNIIIILVMVVTRFKHAVASCIKFGKFDVFFLTGNREIESSNIQQIIQQFKSAISCGVIHVHEIYSISMSKIKSSISIFDKHLSEGFAICSPPIFATLILHKILLNTTFKSQHRLNTLYLFFPQKIKTR